MKRIVSGIMLTLLLIGMLTLKFNVKPVESLGSNVLFFDDFDDGVADGWTEDLGSWSVVDGECYTSIGVANSFTTVDDLSLTNCVIEAKLRFNRTLPSFRAGIVFRYSGNTHCYAFEISDEYDVAWMIIYTPEHPLYGYKNDNMTVPISISPNVNYTLRVEIVGNTFTGYVDDQEILSWTDANYTNGKVGLQAHSAQVFFDNFVVLKYPLITVPDDYPTIQEAINAASDGDTIFVRNGTYYENVVVNKTVSLIGEGRETTVIDGWEAGKPITVRSENVYVSNFTVQNGRFSSILISSNSNVLENNRILGADFGTTSWGIYLSGSNNTVRVNVIENCGHGIFIESSSYNKVIKNTVTNNHYGIWLKTAPHIPEFPPPPPSSFNIIYHNSFIENDVQAYDHGFSNLWDMGYPSGGNYWSDYSDIDVYSGPYQNETGSDGIGDMPYVIDSNGQDRYPLMQPWPAVNVKTEPKVLNMLDRDEWFDCVIESPLLVSYDANTSTVLMGEPVHVYPESVVLGDLNNNSVPDLLVRFSRYEIIGYAICQVMENARNCKFFGGFALRITLTITGKVGDTTFEVKDVIAVVSSVLAIPI